MDPWPWAPQHAVSCLKAAGARSVWLVRRPGESARTVKAWPFTTALAFKLAVGQAQAQRHRRNARRLAACGVATPTIRRGPSLVRRNGARLVEIELDHVDGRMPLDVLREGSDEERRSAARAVGELLAALVAARLFNRDLKLSNIVIARDGDEVRAWLLDPVGVRRLSRTREQTVRMLERLAIEPRELGLPIGRDVARATLAPLRTGRPIGPGVGEVRAETRRRGGGGGGAVSL